MINTTGKIGMELRNKKKQLEVIKQLHQRLLQHQARMTNHLIFL